MPKRRFDLSTNLVFMSDNLACLRNWIATAPTGWKNGLKEFQLVITSAVCSYMGEQYTDFETVHRTVGFTTEGLRADRIARTKRVSDFAHDLGIPGVSCHIGFIPSDPATILYRISRPDQVAL